nr:hypothetical protein 2 [Piscirickettsiaceae bacterium]
MSDYDALEHPMDNKSYIKRRISELEQKNAELKAHCVDLKAVLRMVANTPINELSDLGIIEKVMYVLDKTPQ